MAEGKNLIGVDIGSSAIKVCQLRESRKGYGLAKLGYAALPAQSLPATHCLPSTQPPHEPPQSISLSAPFLTPSLQEGATHRSP